MTLSSGESEILVNGKSLTVPTRSLSWGAGDGAKLAAVSKKKAVRLYNEAGKRIGSVPSCTVLPVLRTEEKRCLVVYGETRGYLMLEDAELLDPVSGEIRKGVISVNGSTSGRATVKLRFGPSDKERIVDSWKTGTGVLLIRKENDFWQVEGNGIRVWVHQDYVTAEDEHGTEINEG